LLQGFVDMRRLLACLLLAPFCLAAAGCRTESPESSVDRLVAEASGADESVAPEPAPGEQPAPTSAMPTASPDDATADPAGNALPNPKQPPADDEPAVPITFDDLQLELEPDSLFDPAMLTDRVRELDGRRVRIRGFIFPSVFQQTGITSFPLIKNLECKFGPGGQSHHIILVEMKPNRSTSFTVRPVAVQGILSVRPWNGPDGNTWALYHLAGEKVQ
jgi:hypothetical protein